MNPPVIRHVHGNPLRRWRRRILAAWTTGVPLVALTAWWALNAGEIQPRLPSIPDAAVPRREAGADQPAPLDLRPFAKRLTPAPPPPAPKALVSEPPAAPAIGLELIGIVRRGDGFAAILYDPRDDRVHVAVDGDDLGGVVVAKVIEREVLLSRGSEQRALVLARRREGIGE